MRLFFFAIIFCLAALFFFQKNPINLAIKHNIVERMPGDIEPQQPLTHPPSTIKAIYATSWSAGSEKRMTELIKLIKETELNALVIDVKDYTGAISYLGPERQIAKINTLIKRLHDENIYLIGRVAVFEDQTFTLTRPDLALKNKLTGELWKNYKGLHWLDAAAIENWDHTVTIAEDMIDRGFDEINFDYIRFTSDGNMETIAYPKWDATTPRHETMRRFFAYLREKLPNAKLSADLFGMTTTNADDLGIGQRLEDALPYFDAIAPMVYPSHYIKGFIGYENPATAPYEVVKYSMDQALVKIANYNKQRLRALTAGDVARIQSYPPLRGVLRPWLQDFDIGATYDKEKVFAQIKAVTEDTIRAPKHFGGWMLWDPKNHYTKEALTSE